MYDEAVQAGYLGSTASAKLQAVAQANGSLAPSHRAPADLLSDYASQHRVQAAQCRQRAEALKAAAAMADQAAEEYEAGAKQLSNPPHGD